MIKKFKLSIIINMETKALIKYIDVADYIQETITIAPSPLPNHCCK